MGTAEVISTCFTTPRAGSAMLEANYPCYCHAVADHYFTITLNQSGGLSLEWFQNNVMGLDQLSEQARVAAVRSLLDEIRIQPSLVMFLPHIVGSGTPTCDHLSRGTFLGLSLKTGRRDMFQAVADVLAFEARLNLETLADRDIPILELRGVGGGTRSERLLELKATVLNSAPASWRTWRSANSPASNKHAGSACSLTGRSNRAATPWKSMRRRSNGFARYTARCAASTTTGGRNAGRQFSSRPDARHIAARVLHPRRTRAKSGRNLRPCGGRPAAHSRPCSGGRRWNVKRNCHAVGPSVVLLRRARRLPAPFR
ncbi:MAG: FGGY-family carbohydrate kinase [Candidatus Solibacter sp.]|nr:FGGY-family carbohydrate kinase [Candidatus Solibacter sp.]